MPVADQDARVVDRLGEAELEDLGLQAALEEVGGFEREHVIELHLGLIEDTKAREAAAGKKGEVAEVSGEAANAEKAEGAF